MKVLFLRSRWSCSPLLYSKSGLLSDCLGRFRFFLSNYLKFVKRKVFSIYLFYLHYNKSQESSESASQSSHSARWGRSIDFSFECPPRRLKPSVTRFHRASLALQNFESSGHSSGLPPSRIFRLWISSVQSTVPLILFLIKRSGFDKLKFLIYL